MNNTNFEFKGFNDESEQIQALIAMLESGEDFSVGEFLVCSEDGKSEALEENIKESLWAFNTNFLMSNISDKKELFENLANVFPIYDYVNVEYTSSNDNEEEDENEEFEIDYDSIDENELEKALQAYQQQKCESANDLILGLIDDLESLIEDAESADGAGHFLAGYDHNEIEVSTRTDIYYIYRTN